MGFGRRGAASVIDLGQHKEATSNAEAAFDEVVTQVRDAILPHIDQSQVSTTSRGAIAKQLTDLASECNVPGFDALNRRVQRQILRAPGVEGKC